MTTKEAIEALSLLRIFDAPDLNEAVKMAVAALRYQANTLPNDPLTLEDLREMDGEPVWVYNSYNGWCNCRVVECIKPEDVFFTDDTVRRISSYGDGWLAYRRRPEEGMM